MAVHEERIQLGAGTVRFMVAGAGPPLVLLHGLGDSAVDWAWVLPRLAASYRVFAPDRPGSGGSDRPRTEPLPEFVEGWRHSFLDAVGVQRAVLVGNSLGGLVARRAALTSPERVEALALVDSTGLGKETTPVLAVQAPPGLGELGMAWAGTVPGSWHPALGRAWLMFARPWAAPRAWIADQVHRAQTPGFLETTLATLRADSDFFGQREVRVERLPELRQPTLVVWGLEDRVVPVGHAHRAAALLEHGRLSLLPTCGHLPQVEQPEGFVRELGQFLEHAAHPNGASA